MAVPQEYTEFLNGQRPFFWNSNDSEAVIQKKLSVDEPWDSLTSWCKGNDSEVQ